MIYRYNLFCSPCKHLAKIIQGWIPWSIWRSPLCPLPTGITPELCFLTQREQVSEDTENVQDDLLVTGALKWKHLTFRDQFRAVNFMLHRAAVHHGAQRQWDPCLDTKYSLCHLANGCKEPYWLYVLKASNRHIDHTTHHLILLQNSHLNSKSHLSQFCLATSKLRKFCIT